MKRRSFLGSLLAGTPAVILGLKRKTSPNASERTPASPDNAQAVLPGSSWIPVGRRVALMQGMTNQESAQIVVLGPATEKLRYAATDATGKPLPMKVQDRMRGINSRYATERLVITGLSLQQRYTLYIYGADGTLVDTRYFRALDTAKNDCRFAVMSCMDDRSSVHRGMWAEVISQKPEMMFFIGDNVYVDSEDIENSAEYIWNRYVETRLTLDIFQIQELIPTIAIWDDHDFGEDNGNRTFALKADVLQIFRAFFGSVESAGFINGPGVSNMLGAFGQRFVLFDDRYWRDPANPGYQGKNGKQWGPEQVEWMFSNLDQNSAAPLWLINGSMFFGAYHLNESVERESPEEFKGVRERLMPFRAPVILVSGDVHYAEVSQIEAAQFGHPTMEFTTSAIHCTPADYIRRNGRRIFANARNNFMIIETTAASSKVDITVTVHGINAAVYHTSSHTITKKS